MADRRGKLPATNESNNQYSQPTTSEPYLSEYAQSLERERQIRSSMAGSGIPLSPPHSSGFPAPNFLTLSGTRIDQIQMLWPHTTIRAPRNPPLPPPPPPRNPLLPPAFASRSDTDTISGYSSDFSSSTQMEPSGVVEFCIYCRRYSWSANGVTCYECNRSIMGNACNGRGTIASSAGAGAGSSFTIQLPEIELEKYCFFCGCLVKSVNGLKCPICNRNFY